MKTRVWKRLSWDLRIVYNKVTKEFVLEKYDYDWQTYATGDTMKEVVSEKHNLIKQRIRDRGLFNEVVTTKIVTQEPTGRDIILGHHHSMGIEPYPVQQFYVRRQMAEFKLNYNKN